MPDLFAIEQSLGLTFEDKTLLYRALTHRSYLNENPDHPLEDNERLEFLGDAVLDFATAEYLYHHFPEMDEGRLTSLRAALVCATTLAGFARDLRLNDLLFLGTGEAESGGRERQAILSGAFEALVGALYLDQGLKAVQDFIYPIIGPEAQMVIAEARDKDAKSLLQELSQGHFQVTPTYRTVAEKGPDHAKEFTVEVLIGKKPYGRGQGHSKQQAAQAAAQVALERLEQEIISKSSGQEKVEL
jgi:ribonuclease-3